MRPFFRYFGSKWSLVPYYPRPLHDLIVEPFAGSACYATRLEPQRAVLCDLDHYIAGVWRYLIATPASEILRLPLLGKDQTVDDLGPVPQEARWLVGFWLNQSHSPCRSFSTWAKHYWDDPAFFRSRWSARSRASIAMQVDKIRGWQVREGDYRCCSDLGPATWFVDPPYQRAGKKYLCGSDGFDFAFLAEWCRTRPGQTIVCENAGAEWLPFEPLARGHSTMTRKQTNAEVVWSPDWQPPRQGSLF